MEGETHESSAIMSAHGIRKEFFRKGRESARYFDAVATCDVELAAGELTVLMGRSGSGKSTLLNMLSGLLEPTEGCVEFRGESLYALDDAALSRLRNESFGSIPQGQTAIHSLSVIENVMLPYRLYRSDSCEDRAFELLDDLGISELADSYPAELSGGELRRMAIARALICSPSIIFADEPTSDLDDENTNIVLATLRGIADDGASVFMVTHEATAADQADRVLRMDAGKLG